MPLPSSSPPLLPQSSFAELPSSPPLLPTTPSSATLPWIPATRKRQLSEQDCHISSDPLFSDDTSGTEDASRYQRPKRKRMIRGPWWEIANKEGRRGTQDVATPKQKDFSRNVDSGIWMGSDGSEDSTESTSCYPDSMRRLHVTDHSRSLQTPRAAPQQFVLHPLSLSSPHQRSQLTVFQTYTTEYCRQYCDWMRGEWKADCGPIRPWTRRYPQLDAEAIARVDTPAAF